MIVWAPLQRTSLGPELSAHCGANVLQLLTEPLYHSRPLSRVPQIAYAVRDETGEQRHVVKCAFSTPHIVDEHPADASQQGADGVKGDS